MYLIDTRMIFGLFIWIFGFALMMMGWLTEVLFERYGELPGKVLHKTGAAIVALPVIYALYRTAGLLYSNRVDIALFLNGVSKLLGDFPRLF